MVDETVAGITIPPELRPVPLAVRSPLKYAAFLTGSYLIIGSVYIVVSTRIVAAISGSIERMEELETVKGTGFIVVTAGLLFWFTYLLFKRVRRQEQLIARQVTALHHSERAMLAGTFATSIAHDINNALTISHSAVERLRDQTTGSAEVDACLADLDRSLAMIQEWNKRLFDIGRHKNISTRARVDLCALVNGAVRLVQRHAHLRDRHITTHIPPGSLWWSCSEQLVHRAVLNLLLNAAEAAGHNGHIEVTLETLGDDSVLVRVDDDGSGVPLELRSTILEPFFTTKPNGSGLGMTSVVACAKLHAGRVHIDTSPSGGARFDLVLKQ